MMRPWISAGSGIPRRVVTLLLFAMLAFGATSYAIPAEYPNRPVKLIVSALPGAATDVMARVVAERLSPRLGQPIVVENRAGASSMLAADQLAQSAPDGHTLMVSPNSLLIAPHMLPKGSASGVDVVKDIVPVVVTASTPIVLLINPALNIKTIPELLARAKKAPEVTYASGGTGSALHLAGELFQKATGVKLVHIPYKGLAGATTDVVAGTVNMMFGTPGGVMGEMISSGKLVPLAIADKKRSPLLPDVPTLREVGIEGADLDAWFMMFAPAGTPPDILQRQNSETTKVLALPEVRQRLVALGVAPGGGSLESAAITVKNDFARYGEIVREANIAGK
jgi:tripartite-type tricarboxylate transporter receptor subunit TctC